MQYEKVYIEAIESNIDDKKEEAQSLALNQYGLEDEKD